MEITDAFEIDVTSNTGGTATNFTATRGTLADFVFPLIVCDAVGKLWVTDLVADPVRPVAVHEEVGPLGD